MEPRSLMAIWAAAGRSELVGSGGGGGGGKRASLARSIGSRLGPSPSRPGSAIGLHRRRLRNENGETLASLSPRPHHAQEDLRGTPKCPGNAQAVPASRYWPPAANPLPPLRDDACARCSASGARATAAAFGNTSQACASCARMLSTLGRQCGMPGAHARGGRRRAVRGSAADCETAHRTCSLVGMQRRLQGWSAGRRASSLRCVEFNRRPGVLQFLRLGSHAGGGGTCQVCTQHRIRH